MSFTIAFDPPVPPTGGVPAAGTVHLRCRWVGAGGPFSYSLFVDGAGGPEEGGVHEFLTGGATEYVFTIDTTLLSDGSHLVSVVAVAEQTPPVGPPALAPVGPAALTIVAANGAAVRGRVPETGTVVLTAGGGSADVLWRDQRADGTGTAGGLTPPPLDDRPGLAADLEDVP